MIPVLPKPVIRAYRSYNILEEVIRLKSFRQKLCALLAVSMMTSVAFTGCSGKDSGVSAPASGAGSSSTPSKAMVTLNFWCVGTAQDAQSRVSQAINSYLKDTLKTNIQVNYQELGYGDDYNKKVSNALSTGQAVDVVFTANWAANFAQNAMAGNFLALEDYLKQYPDVVKILSQSFIDASKINGHTYALPTNKEKFHAYGYMLRSDLVKKYGIDVSKIKTLADMDPIFAEIKQKEPGVTPLAIGTDMALTSFLDWDNIGDQQTPGALYPSADGSSTIVNQFTTPEEIGIYKMTQDYVKKGYISRDAASQTISALIPSGKYFAFPCQLTPGKDAAEKVSTGIDWTQVQITPYRVSNQETTGAMLAIPKTSQHADEAMQFISLLYTDPTLLNLFIYGQEGTDYTKNANGTVTLIKGSGYADGNGFRFGNQLKNHLLDFEPADKYQQYEKINDTAPKLQSYGFRFDSTSTEVQTEMAANNAIVSQYNNLMFGTAPDIDAAVNAMKAKYKAANADKLIQTMQEQYDAWRKTKK